MNKEGLNNSTHIEDVLVNMGKKKPNMSNVFVNIMSRRHALVLRASKYCRTPKRRRDDLVSPSTDPTTSAPSDTALSGTGPPTTLLPSAGLSTTAPPSASPTTSPTSAAWYDASQCVPTHDAGNLFSAMHGVWTR
ncbi:hypothetical protein PR001_g2735 [Phytophthora rubi]|uniref:Uncharacterized protein n=1 Tax=Phytophthora rubi TaxID=129364 RepID=A0A6A3NZF9_9STRA|nr:hypothetical protein PR002_g2305 [Phytophthora rubi]KAE9050063.1 hypothetical protein PR001_g2735 [Phytophthora rubi]